MLDAALAGLRLERNPQSLDLRRDAAHIWSLIHPILSHRLDAEVSQLLPWLDQHRELSPKLGQRVRECHSRLRTLMGVVASRGANHLTDAQVREAGKALTGLAVILDDMIDDEERRLFPTLRKALFGSGRRA